MQLRDNELLEVFETCSNLGALAQVHAENGDIISHVRLFLIMKKLLFIIVLKHSVFVYN